MGINTKVHKDDEVLSNTIDAFYIMSAIERDITPLIAQFKHEHGVDVTIRYYGYWGCESVAYDINGHFGYVWQFYTDKPTIKAIGFGEEPLPDASEHSVELILEPFLQKALRKYTEMPIKDLANDDEIDEYFNHIVEIRGYV